MAGIGLFLVGSPTSGAVTRIVGFILFLVGVIIFTIEETKVIQEEMRQKRLDLMAILHRLYTESEALVGSKFSSIPMTLTKIATINDKQT